MRKLSRAALRTIANAKDLKDVTLNKKRTYEAPKIVELGVASILTAGSGNRASDTSVGMHSA